MLLYRSHWFALQSTIYQDGMLYFGHIHVSNLTKLHIFLWIKCFEYEYEYELCSLLYHTLFFVYKTSSCSYSCDRNETKSWTNVGHMLWGLWNSHEGPEVIHIAEEVLSLPHYLGLPGLERSMLFRYQKDIIWLTLKVKRLESLGICIK